MEDINRISKELQNGYKAQKDGNEGLARVCARRAAGWAIQINLNQKGIDLQSPSALVYINYLKDQPDIPEKLHQVLGYLVKRVEKDNEDEDSYWPLPEIDLVKEAHWLAEKMLKSKITI